MSVNKKITWNLAGAFAKHNLIMQFFKNNEAFNRYKKIIVYDGIENCIWNGGRVNQEIPYSDLVRDTYYSLGWSINLTFTNFIINNLRDPVGNFLLEKLHKKGNGIILVNDDLRRYIRKNYPKYRIIYSITGCGTAKYPMDDSTFNFYKNILKKYDLLVPRCDNHYDKRLRELDISKMELLVSDTCIFNCPHWDEHFRACSELNRSGTKGLDQIECWIPKEEFNRRVEIEKKAFKDKYPFSLNSKQIKNLIEEGFYNFKIQGRESKNKEYVADLARFLVDYDNI